MDNQTKVPTVSSFSSNKIMIIVGVVVGAVLLLVVIMAVMGRGGYKDEINELGCFGFAEKYKDEKDADFLNKDEQDLLEKKCEEEVKESLKGLEDYTDEN